MTRKTDPAKLNDAVEFYLSGQAFSQVHATIGVSGSVLARELASRGIPARGRRLGVDADALVSAYLAGESEYALAMRLNLSRTVIRLRLLEAGVQIRRSSEAGYLRASKLPREIRMDQVTAAHVARRGQRVSQIELEARAVGREREGKFGSDGEALLAQMLEERDLLPVAQRAIGKYNVDMAAAETVAVEVLGGNWHASKRTHAARTPQILNAGWHLVMVWNHKGTGPITAGAADYIATFCEETRWHPTLVRQYRVISGSGDLLAARCADDDEFPLVPPSRRAARPRP